MKLALMLFIVLTLAGQAFLVDPAHAVDRMGASGDPDVEIDHIVVEPVGIYTVYVCIFEPSVNSIAAFECSLDFTESDLFFALNSSFPNDGVNFGLDDNLIVGFPTPVPASDVTVVAWRDFLILGAPLEVLVLMGPADPSSFGGEAPGYADGEDFEHLVPCTIPADGVVGTITTEVVATETRSLSAVKALFR
jgi:hypothetical protein